MNIPMLSVKNLNVLFESPNGFISAVNNISFNIKQKKRIAIIGESGSGKTVLLSSLCGFLKGEPGIVSGEILYNSQNLLNGIEKIVSFNSKENTVEISKNEFKYNRLLAKIRNTIRGDISFIFQDPNKALDPLYTIEQQMMEALSFYNLNNNKTISLAEGKDVCLDWLSKVNISNPITVLKQFPTELSGGMLQRVMIAISMIIKPKILIADEPTTALDTTTSFLVLDLFQKIYEENNISLIFVTHDIALAERISDEIIVMNSGQIIEQGSSKDILHNGINHPYTGALLKARLNPLATNKETSIYYLKDKLPEELYLNNGCKFRLRCSIATKECKDEVEMRNLTPNHSILCRNINQ